MTKNNKCLFISLAVSLVLIIVGVVMFSVLGGFNDDGFTKDKTVITVTGDPIVTVREDFRNDLDELCKTTQVIDGYILSKENDNRATDIFILNLEDGGKLHPSSEDGQLVTGVASDQFEKVKEKLADSPYGDSVIVQISGSSYVYAAKMAMMTAGSPEVSNTFRR